MHLEHAPCNCQASRSLGQVDSAYPDIIITMNINVVNNQIILEVLSRV